MKRFFNTLFHRTPTRPIAKRVKLGLDTLDRRDLPSITTGSLSGGITWSFDYNPSTRVGTLTVNGTGADESIALQEAYVNANPGEPGYGDTRPYGINIISQGGEDQGGPSFSPDSRITVVVHANAGNDRVLNTTRFASALHGGAGNDNLAGGTGNDTLYGGTGHDQLFGGSGNDELWGDRMLVNGAYADPANGAGNDTLLGNMGADTVRGGGGNDYLVGDHGSRQWVNGALIWVSVASDGSGSAGSDVLYGDAGNDTLQGGYGNDSLYGGSGSDWLFGGYGNDALDGGTDRDYLYGGNGTDTLDGGAGSDLIRLIGSNDPFWAWDQFDQAHAVDSGGDNDNGQVRVG
jgi:Ca2+-binding RTX toxin-like protein